MLPFDTSNSCNCIIVEFDEIDKVHDKKHRGKEYILFQMMRSQRKILEREVTVATYHILTLIRLTQAQSAQNPLFSTKVSSFLLKMRKKVAVASIFLIQRFDVDFSHHC